ncbi:MarR family transcriptional regulator OS=Streptomyces alboniger OX=132473 GN=CP975_22225 PE=4 SV=1 [Streptomyces alboniger]
MAELTHDWAPEEREAFCALLTRSNSALSSRMSAQGLPGAEPPSAS